jgi:hypothetical protein
MEKIQANAPGTPEAVVERLGRYVAQCARHLRSVSRRSTSPPGSAGPTGWWRCGRP